MNNKHPAQLEQKPTWPVIFNAILASVTAAGTVSWIAFFQLPPVGWHDDHSFITSAPWLLELLKSSWDAAVASQSLFQYLRDPLAGLQVFIQNIDRFDLVAPISWRLAMASAVTLLIAFAVGIQTYARLDTVDRLKHIRGRQLLKGRKATQQAAKVQRKLIRNSGRGINVAPRVPISLETETKHFLLVGASGGGKTQTLRYWIDQALQRQDKILIHDTKGDMAASLPLDDFILLAPHDSRSWAWDIAQDCTSAAAARELASRLVPLGNDPMWGNGAREIFSGIIRSLQINHGDHWDWNMLHDAAFSSPADLLSLLNGHHLDGAKYIEVDEDTGIPTKTSFSFLVTMWSSIGAIVGPLAAAWGDVPADRKVSITAWLSKNDMTQRALVLQRSSEFSELSEAWIGAAVQLMANYAASTSFGDSPDRRIWLFLDEFSQLGKLKGFQQFLEVGRSRGIRCAIGLQDLEQLSDLYGKEALNTWLNTIETKIICRMNAGPSANFIAKDLIGEREVAWKERTTSNTSGNLFENRSGTRSVNEQTRTAMVPVLLPDFLERQIGPVHLGGEIKIRALLIAGGDLFQLDWPITPWPIQRATSEPAAWTVD